MYLVMWASRQVVMTLQGHGSDFDKSLLNLFSPFSHPRSSFDENYPWEIIIWNWAIHSINTWVTRDMYKT